MASSPTNDLQRGEKIHVDHANVEEQQAYEKALPFDDVPKTLGAGVSHLWQH
jgi:hypothetical protein